MLTTDQSRALLRRRNDPSFPEDVRLLAEELPPLFFAALSFPEVITIARHAGDESSLQARLLQLDCVREATFHDWAYTPRSMPDITSFQGESVVLTMAAARMEMLGTLDEWHQLAMDTGPGWYLEFRGYGTYYDLVWQAFERRATTHEQLVLAFQRSMWSEEARLDLFRRLLALSPTFELLYEKVYTLLYKRRFPNTNQLSASECTVLYILLFEHMERAAAAFEDYARLLGIIVHSSMTEEQRGIIEVLQERVREKLVASARTRPDLLKSLELLKNLPAHNPHVRALVSAFMALETTFAESIKLASEGHWRPWHACRAALQVAARLAATDAEKRELLRWAVREDSVLRSRHDALLRDVLAVERSLVDYLALLALEYGNAAAQQRILAALAATPRTLAKAYVLALLATPDTPIHESGRESLANPSIPFSDWEQLLQLQLCTELFPEELERFRRESGSMGKNMDLPARRALVLQNLHARAAGEREWRVVRELAVVLQDAGTIAHADRALAALAIERLDPSDPAVRIA